MFKAKWATLALAAGMAIGGAQAATVFEGEAFLGGDSNDSVATAQDLGALLVGSTITVFGSRLDVLPGTDTADFYMFTLGSAAVLTMTVDTPLGYNFENDPVVGLYDGGGVQLATDDDGGNGYDAKLVYTVSAGTYYVAVSGYSDFDFVGGGSTNWPYNLGVSAAAVPEPGTYAMLAAGLGMLGFLARRRRAD